MEQDHAVRRRDEARRIRLEQERDYARFQEQLKLMKKEVSWAEAGAEEYWDPLGCKGSKPQLQLASAIGSFGSRLPAKLMSGYVQFSVLQPHCQELLLHHLGLVLVTASCFL